jgi:hypothetical protein
MRENEVALLTIDAIPAASVLDPETRAVFPGNDEDEKSTRGRHA